MQRNVLSDEYSNTNAAEVEAVQELMDLWQLVQAQLHTKTAQLSSGSHGRCWSVCQA